MGASFRCLTLKIYTMRKAIWLLIFPLGVFLFSCTSTQRVSEMAYKSMAPILSGETYPNSDYLKLYSKAAPAPAGRALVNTKRLKSTFLPLLLFWMGGESLQTEVDNSYFINLFGEALQQKDKSYNLKHLLKGRSLEITLEKLPSLYRFDSNWYFFFLFFVYGFGEQQVMYSARPELQVSYSILEAGGCELKNGRISVERENMIYNKRPTSVESFAEMYFKALENEFYNQSSNLLEQIIDEIYKLDTTQIRIDGNNTTTEDSTLATKRIG